MGIAEILAILSLKAAWMTLEKSFDFLCQS
jgi:hypothetical protein